MTSDEALAALAAARLQLFTASQKRESVVTRRVRIESPEAFEQLNADIADARAAVLAATAAVQAATIEAP